MEGGYDRRLDSSPTSRYLCDALKPLTLPKLTIKYLRRHSVFQVAFQWCCQHYLLV